MGKALEDRFLLQRVIPVQLLNMERASTVEMPPYSTVIQGDARSNIFVVTVPEFPGCRTHGKTYEEAIKQGLDAIESWLMADFGWKRSIPPPRVVTNPNA